MKNCYNIYANSFVSTIGRNNCIDYVFIQNSSSNTLTNQLYLLRVTNVWTEFLVIKFPGISLENFIKNVRKITLFYSCEFEMTKMKDSQLYTFEHEFDYAVVKSKNIWRLNECFRALKLFAHTEYTRIKNIDKKYYRVENDGTKSELDHFDSLMYRYTESPFRYTLNSLNKSNLPYYMSTKFDIPIVGPLMINLKECEVFKYNDSINCEEQFRIKNDFFKCCYTIEYENLISKNVYGPSTDSSPLNSLKIMSYDIETYNPDENPDSSKKHQAIICIGFSVFNVNDPKPIKRYSFITKNFDQEDIKRYKSKPEVIDTERKTHKYYLYDYRPETNFDNVRTDFGAEDATDYMFCGNPIPEISENKDELTIMTEMAEHDFKNERRLLYNFINFIKMVKPFAITAFNNWKFDDEWIYTKCKLHNLEKELLGSLSFYVTTTAKFKTVKPKLDGEVIKDNQYKTFVNGFTLFHDVMLTAIKEDSKKFSQRNRANLDTMLMVFNIVSPYNGKTLSKTEMKIPYMFKCWKNNEHTYLIAKYCCQDAWITGCLAISRNMFGDLIEMSNMTNTSFNDSLHKAVGIRVTNTIQWYAHHSNIAYYDTPDNESRNHQLHSAIGEKYFDKRTLIGGAVKNKRNGREFFIQALDFSSMYPSQKEGSNTDTSSRVDEDIIHHPEYYGLKLVDKYYLEDVYTARWFYEFESITTQEHFYVEQFFCEYKIDPKEIKALNTKYHEIRLNNDISKRLFIGIQNDLLRRMKNLLYGEDENYLNRKNYGNSMDEQFQIEKSKYFLLADYVKDVPSIEDTLNYDEQRLIEKYKDLKLPARVLFPIYFVQSPKDPKTNLPIIHYSLKEKMLSDLRAKRTAVKKTKPRNLTEAKQINAKQLAIKIVMNSEYGQTGSDLFAHYDSDIGAAVTFASRKCIAELTSCLLSEHFYVNESYKNNKHLIYLQDICRRFNDNSIKFEYIEYKPTLESCLEGTQRNNDDLERIKKECFDEYGNFIKSIDIFSEIDFRLPPRRLTSATVYESLRKQYKEDPSLKIMVWRITVPKSELVYQDTDSNYYTNEYLISLWDVLNPDTINEIMQTLFEHDSLLGDLISEIINRRPIGVGWEGAFVVARYLNKKKKYYGKKWTIPAEGGLMKSTITIPRSKDYDMNEYEQSHSKINDDGTIKIEYDWKHLPDDYENYLTLKEKGKYQTYNCLIPYRDGSYFKVKDFPKEGVDTLDYVNSHGIKCTGVDLARRDQYKFININNMLIYQNDLKYCEADPNDITTLEVKNPIKYKHEKVKLTTVVEKLMHDFKNVTIYDYDLEDYTRTKSYKADKRTEVRVVVGKLRNEIASAPTPEIKVALEGVLPTEGERTSYVMISPDNMYGIIVGSKIEEKAYILGHLLNKPLEYDSTGKKQYRLIGQEEFDMMCSKNQKSKIFKKIEDLYITASYNDLFKEDTYYVIEHTRMTREMIFESLDFRYYYECLAEVLCNYIVIEENPDIAKYINGVYNEEHPEMSDKEIETEMAKVIAKTKKDLAQRFIKVAFPARITSTMKRTKKNCITIQYTCPNLNEVFTLENSIKHIINQDPASWDNLMGYPDIVRLSLQSRISILNQNQNVPRDISIKLIELYEQMKKYVTKRYNLDNSIATIVVVDDGQTKLNQKYSIYYNPTDSDKKKFAKDSSNHIVSKQYPSEIFGDINDISNFIITQVSNLVPKININKPTPNKQPFSIPVNSGELITKYIINLFKIIDIFDIIN